MEFRRVLFRSEALERQAPFINSTLAQHALALLARVFRYGEINYHGGFINLASGIASVLKIDPKYWKRTRRLNKHRGLLKRLSEEGSNGRANQRRTDGPDRRA